MLSRGLRRAPGDLYWNSVSLLLNCDGANGGTSFPDASKNGFVPTVYGTIATSTTRAKFGNASILCAANSRLNYAANSAFNITGGNFCIEFWCYPTSAPSVQGVLIAQDDGIANGTCFQLKTYPTNKLNFTYWTTSSRGSYVEKNGNTALSNNVWTHVAVTWDGSTLRMFLNGALDASFAVSAMYSANFDMGIGNWARPTFSNPFVGNLDDIRITKGQTRYTAAFTPPSRPFPTH